MLINEVCFKVGMTRKTIRYYESEGLIRPIRNQNNDYREYTEEDLNKLKLIKFLRELNVPIIEVKKLFNKELSLKECLNNRISSIERELNDFEKIKELCLEVIDESDDLFNIDLNKYYERMNILNKKGVTMREPKKNNKSKILGAVLSSAIFSLIFIAIGATITYFQFTEAEKAPWIIYGIIMFLFIIPVLGIVYNLIIRIKEIKKGEEDEASKY